MLVDCSKKLLGPLQTEGNMTNIKVLHIMAAFHVLVHDAVGKKKSYLEQIFLFYVYFLTVTELAMVRR